MNKLYKTITTLMVAALPIFAVAQNSQNAPGVSISPANAGLADEITMTVDLNAICMPSGKDALPTFTTNGFHSTSIGTDSSAWSNSIEFDAADAVEFTVDVATGIATVTFTPTTYYGLTEAEMLGFGFVMNGGAANGGWDNEGKAFDDAGNCADFFVYLPFTPDPVGVENISNNKLSIYPNPANQSLNVDFGSVKANNAQLQLINTIGQVVYTGTSNSASINTIDVSSLGAGIYFLSVQNGDDRLVEKIQIQ